MWWMNVLPVALVFALAALGLVGFIAAFRNGPLTSRSLERIRYRHHRFQVALSALVTGVALLAHSALAHLRFPPSNPALITFFLAGAPTALASLGLLNRIVWEPAPVDPQVSSGGSSPAPAAGLAAGQALAVTVGAIAGGASLAFLLVRLRTSPETLQANPLPLVVSVVSALLVVGVLLRARDIELEGPEAHVPPPELRLSGGVPVLGGFPTVLHQLYDPATGTFIHQDPDTRTFWGLTPQRFRSDPAAWLQRVHPEDRHRVQRVAESHRGLGADATYRIQHPERGERWVRDRVHRPREGRGPWLRVVEDVTRDPRRRREAPGEPGAMDPVGEQVLEELPVHVAVVDGEGVIRYVNLPSEEAEEVVGTPADAYFPGDDRESFHQALEAAGEGADSTVEVTVDGEEGLRRLECMVEPHPGGDGAIVVAVDVTERWRMERLLQEEVTGLAEELERLEARVGASG